MLIVILLSIVAVSILAGLVVGQVSFFEDFAFNQLDSFQIIPEDD